MEGFHEPSQGYHLPIGGYYTFYRLGGIFSQTFKRRPRSPLDGRCRPSVDDWKIFCRRHVMLEKAWVGKAVAVKKTVDIDGPAEYYRFRIDEEQRTMICTNRRGGLQVICALESTLLWSLPQSYVPPCAHLEYAHGFVIFDRRDGVEVWRRETDGEASGLSPCPDAAQLNVWDGPSDLSTARGRYRPFAAFRFPSDVRIHNTACRYPHVIAESLFTQEVYIWHIPTATLIQTLSLTRLGDSITSDIDISDDHIFLCSFDGLVVYSRHTGAVVFEISCEPPPGEVESALSQALRLGAPLHAPTTMNSYSLVLASKYEAYAALSTGFAAVRASPSGRDLIAISRHGLVCYVSNFMECVKLEDHMQTLSLNSRAVVSMAHDGHRIAVCTGNGIYCITVSNPPSGAIPLLSRTITEHAFPSPSAQRVSFFSTTSTLLEDVTCMQLTPTSLWLTWPSDDSPSTRNLCYVDFTGTQ
ncbi:hypothetical protein BOTBODRAFT_394089 [Botryobasidium botryosum FD-172 SS1]|uniref:Uncharacterized protein n=1 Tax=Botryobasidium botryosum (strain FD-172 SS1) TaxID=930990 RepID=A0A067N096_BOTB1|nr:hypothetical protein BOTBODRAFT_394089 [Botryobasidium botryosum FD-172 SS1]